MEKLKTIKFKGKDYAEVHVRVNYFRSQKKYENWGEECEILERAEDWSWVLMKVTIRYPDNRIASTGHAFEEKDANHINMRNHVENCETSALGRALGKLGIGSDGSLATYEEIQNAIANEEKDNQKPKHFILEAENWAKALKYIAAQKNKKTLEEIVKVLEEQKYGELKVNEIAKIKEAYDKK